MYSVDYFAQTERLLSHIYKDILQISEILKNVITIMVIDTKF